MGKIIDGIKQGIGILLVLCIFLFGFYLVRGWNGLQATDGDTLGASQWNQLVTKVDTLEGQVSNINGAPSRAVMAFNLTTCPSGRKPADGTNGTPDLRGTFVRGIGGEVNGRDVSRELSSYQEDSFQGHWHKGGQPNDFLRGVGSSASYAGETSSERDSSYGARRIVTDGVNGTPRIGNETRPKNVALLYCIKE